MNHLLDSTVCRWGNGFFNWRDQCNFHYEAILRGEPPATVGIYASRFVDLNHSVNNAAPIVFAHRAAPAFLAHLQASGLIPQKSIRSIGQSLKVVSGNEDSVSPGEDCFTQAANCGYEKWPTTCHGLDRYNSERFIPRETYDQICGSKHVRNIAIVQWAAELNTALYAKSRGKRSQAISIRIGSRLPSHYHELNHWQHGQGLDYLIDAFPANEPSDHDYSFHSGCALFGWAIGRKNPSINSTGHDPNPRGWYFHPHKLICLICTSRHYCICEMS
jgi:hypothetical protein